MIIKAGTHLHFDGQCKEALQFYAECLDGKVVYSMTWNESPMADHIDSEMKEKIIHARFEFGSEYFTADDPLPGNYSKPQGMHIMLLFKNFTEAEKVYSQLSNEAREIPMRFAKTFWSPGFAIFIDRFGTPWMINCEPEN